MNKLIKMLILCAPLCLPFVSHADEIACHSGWTIQRNVTGTQDISHSRFLNYGAETGTIKLLHNGQVISTKRIEYIEQSVYQTNKSLMRLYGMSISK